ncbi:MAG: hypothetical protein FWG80_00375 [Alphaproteobacteria bacterium]|nr:hypothetical protein [Alphaproteobacteria bacterium]
MIKNNISRFTSHTAESGRSLIEVVGVMALGAIMIAGTFQVYQSVQVRKDRMIAAEDLKDIARNSRLLFAGKNNYTGISVGYLIKMGALKTGAAISIASEFDLFPEQEGSVFQINLHGVSFADCSWAATQHFDWVTDIRINDFYEGLPAENCKRDEKNKVTFVVK